MNKPKIVLLAGKGESTNIVYHRLLQHIAFAAVVIEEPVNKKEFLKKRIKKLGIVRVIGQMMFQILVVKSLNIFSKKRKTEIINQNNLINTAIPNKVITNVSSVNDDACKAILNQINPDIIVVNGTRIISKKILSATNARIINMHAGITPNYRGVHGAYWALVNKDNENCGVTIHFVDAGIDTGNIIYQQKITITKQDNFVTYPFLQLAAGLPFLSKAIADISDKSIETVTGSSVSALWSHPTIWQYLLYRVTKNVK